MKQRRYGEKGFTLLEIIVTLVLVGITAVFAGMWLVSIVNGYIFAKTNADTVQKAQLAMTRLSKEFSAINSVDITATDPTSIGFSRADAASGSVAVTVAKDGTDLRMNDNLLTDNVAEFTLEYCNNVTEANTDACHEEWSPGSSRIIKIRLALAGPAGITSVFEKQVTPRNI